MDEALTSLAEDAKRRRLDECKAQIRSLSNNSARGFFEIGCHLKEVKERQLWRLDENAPPSFAEWAAREFGWKDAFQGQLIRLAKNYSEADFASGKLLMRGAIEIERVTESIPKRAKEQVRKETIKRIAAAPEPKVTSKQARAAAVAVAEELGLPIKKRGTKQVTFLRAAPPIDTDSIHVAEAIPRDLIVSFVHPGTGHVVKRIPTNADGSLALEGLILRVELGPSYHANIELCRKLRGYIARS